MVELLMARWLGLLRMRFQDVDGLFVHGSV